MHNSIDEQPVSQDATWQIYELKPALAMEEVKTTSIYVTMRDRVRIAISYHLPAALAEGMKLPTIIHSFFRAQAMSVSDMVKTEMTRSFFS